jgi:hypothetical protein
MKDNEIVNIHVREESRTDQHGNEWYKKMELEIRKEKPKKTLSANGRRAIYFLVIAFLLLMGVSSIWIDKDQHPSSEELIQLVENMESDDSSISLISLWQGKSR